MTPSLKYYPFENPDKRKSGLYLGEQLVLDEPFAKPLAHCLNVHPDDWAECWSAYWKEPEINWQNKDRAEVLRTLCYKWLCRNTLILSQQLSPKQLDLLNNTVKWIILKILLELTDPIELRYHLVRVKLPIERSGGFLPRALNMIIVGTIVTQRIANCDNPDIAAKEITTYFHEDGQQFPLDQLYFDCFDERTFLKAVQRAFHTKYARKNNLYLYFSSGSTYDLNSRQIKDILEEQLEIYNSDKILLDILPQDKALLMKRLVSSFFRHLYQHVETKKELVRDGLLKKKLDELFADVRTPIIPDTAKKYAFILKNTDDKWSIIRDIQQYMLEKTKTKDILMPIRAAMDAGLIRRPTYDEFKAAFPNIRHIAKSSLSYYTNELNTGSAHPYHGPAYEDMVRDFERIKDNTWFP